LRVASNTESEQHDGQGNDDAPLSNLSSHNNSPFIRRVVKVGASVEAPTVVNHSAINAVAC
jgi:hypothetical protein